MQSDSIAKLQRKTSIHKKTSVKADELEFKGRTQESEWKDSSKITNCSLCSKAFTLTFRKHHCRECGGVFCGPCSGYKVVINASLKRSCLSCYKKLIGGSDAQSLVLNNNQAPPERRNDSISEPKKVSAPEPEEPTNDLPTWIDALLFARKIGSDSASTVTNSVKAAFPEETLSAAMVDDILATALSKPMKGTKLKELKFMFRVRDKSLTGNATAGTASTGTGGEVEEITKTTVFYNCYVFYRQEFYGDKASHSKKETGLADTITFGTASDAKLMRQAIVVVSKWPFPQLAFRLLSKLDDGLVWNSDASVNSSLGSASVSGWKEFNDDGRASERSSDDGTSEKHSVSIAPGTALVGGVDLNAVNSVFMTGFAQIAVWPRPKPGTQMYLHFLGELLQYSVAHDVISTYGANLSLATAFSSMNLVTMLGPLGLLQHVWVLWELLVTGQDIVVMAATPTQCAEVVLLLASLTLPLAHAGDVRPYMHPDDSDLAILAATAKRKRIQQASGAPSKDVGTNAMIVGVSDPAALEKLSTFSAVLLLTPQGSGAVADPDAVFKGLRQKNAAQCVQLDQRGYSALGMVGKVVTKKPDSGWVTFVDYFNGWLENNSTIGSANAKPLIVCKIEPSALTIKRTLTKIKNMHPKDRNILGDKLIRDNLKELTVAFFKNNNTEGQSIEATNQQQTAQLRAVAMTEAQKQAVAEARLAKGTIAILVEDLFVGVHKSLPWVSRNVPTIFLWMSYALLLLVTRLSGLPTVLLIGAAFVVKIPTKAPVAFEKSLQKFLPDWLLYPDLGIPQESELDDAALSARAAAAAQASADAARNPRVGRGRKAGRLDFSGVWKRVKLENYENFLAAQGASYIQRNLAVTLPLVHTFTMSKDWMAYNITEKGGPINSNTDVVIGGPPVASQLAKTTFLDTATWENGKLKVVKLKTPDKNYELITHRWLEDNGQTIHITLTHVDFKNGNKETTAHSWFAYQGPSPNEVPASVNPADEADEPDDLAAPLAAAAPKGAAAGNARVGTGKKAGRLELSGSWKRTKVENYENFLGAQGANFMQRKLASSLPLVHTFTMSKDLMVYNLTEKGGPIDSNADFVVGGDPVTTQLAKTQFQDTVSWEDGKLKVVKLKLPEKSYELVTYRWLEDNGNTIHCSLTHVDFKNGNKETTAHSWFAYQGPSTSDRPASLNPADEVEDAPEAQAAGAAPAAAVEDTVAGASASTRKDLSGVWNRTKSVNFEAVIGATGAGFMQRKVAASMSLCHTITMDKALQAVRMQEKGGPINMDFTLTVGNPNAVPYDNNGKKLTHRAYWEGDTLVMHRVVLEGNYEFINKRSLDESTDVKQLVCSITFHDLRSGNQVEATSWFSYAGPSPTPLPVPDLSLLPKVAEAPAPAPEKAVEEDLDDDDDTDEVAVAKMRMSVMVPTSAAAKLFQPAGVATPYNSSPVGGMGGVGGVASPQQDRRPVFTGVWHRDMGQTQGLASKFQLTHTIKQDATTFMLREQDNNGRVLEDLTLVIGGAAIDKLYPQQKRLRCSCYWEGATLVVQQVNSAESYELVLRRNLEENGQQIRLVVTQRSLTTGEESESMSLFTLAAKKM